MRTALVQLTSSDDPAANLVATESLIREAAADGATFVLTPEVTNCVSTSRSRQMDVLRTEEEDATLAALRDLAAELGVNLLIGSLALKLADEPRFVNRSFLIDPAGRIAARYDKIHMFDVTLAEGESYRESAGYRPGSQAVRAQVGDAALGMTICYDMRFPALYRELAQAGAQILTAPSAFTVPTGEAHWHVLLRARAIETGCFVLAPAQCGSHPAVAGKERRTYGHSLAVDPWGRVMADGGDVPGLTLVDIDLAEVATARAKIPSLDHDRDYGSPG
ncbi:MAG: carbon-nitrogen hydrolase family protein [Pseudomonadota bacterium]